MKKYHTGEVIIAVFILFVLWGGWKLSADVIYMDGYESYGFFDIRPTCRLIKIKKQVQQ